MLNGAEVLLPPDIGTAQSSATATCAIGRALRTARAYENKCFLAMANIGMYEGALRGLHGSHGDSAIHNFDGSILNKINGGGEGHD